MRTPTTKRVAPAGPASEDSADEPAATSLAVTPRLLTIMGSGETSPTMVRVHRHLFERLGPSAGGRALLLDTPFGFQENASEIAARAVTYFRDSILVEMEVAGLTGAGDDDFSAERLVSRLRAASYVFAGPGSPSYALRKWRDTIVPQLLAEKLQHGGAVTFSSAAALTLGVATIPVYEIYKVGEDPHWLDGLDLLSIAGVRAAVIPHFDNAEGGTHDTRYCYLGERRLAPMEELLPAGAFVLGIDEHTAIVLDLDAGEASVVGNGVVTVRARGRSLVFESGRTVGIGEIVEAAARLAAGGEHGSSAPAAPSPAQVAAGSAGEGGSTARVLLGAVRDCEATFASSLAEREVEGAVKALLELEQLVIDWSTDIPDGDALDRARASLRSMIVELGMAARAGVRDPAEVVGPFVDSMLELRRRAREAKRFDDSDFIRDQLLRLGVEVRDTPAGTEWLLAAADSGSA
jgi:cyanophycinase-like exopeptidase